jgi:prepilin-type processing-associated H-X9-DG protein
LSLEHQAIWGGDGSGCTAAGGGGCSWEWWFGLQPYAKNIDLWYCPERSDGNAGSYNAYGQALGMKRYAGYGYNWGPIGWRGGGLLGPQLRMPVTNQSYLVGVSATSIENVAEVFAYGDTYDTPRMTVGIGFAADTWNGTRNSQLRHTDGMFNYAFVDGHAKGIKVRGGFMAGAFNNRFIMPKNLAIASKAYCADPTAIIRINPTSGDGTNIPDNIQCDTIPNWIMTNYTPCTNASGPGSNCYFTD